MKSVDRRFAHSVLQTPMDGLIANEMVDRVTGVVWVALAPYVLSEAELVHEILAYERRTPAVFRKSGQRVAFVAEVSRPPATPRR